MKTWKDAIPFFPAKELECKGDASENPCGCDFSIEMDVALAIYLPVLRFEWGKPLTPNSACRCPVHNRNVKGHPNSMHLTKDNPKWPTNGTAAIDIAWRHWTDDEKLEFARFAYARGWSVGLHDGFIHLDRRINCGLRQAVFLYGSNWSGAFAPEDVVNG